MSSDTYDTRALSVDAGLLREARYKHNWFGLASMGSNTLPKLSEGSGIDAGSTLSFAVSKVSYAGSIKKLRRICRSDSSVQIPL